MTTSHLDTEEVERAEAYIAKHFGCADKWVKLNKAIWAVMGAAQDHAFNLSDIDVVTQTASCESDEVLAVLALLSRPSARILTMEFRSERHEGTEVTPLDFVCKLTDWWRNKAFSEDEWRTWA